ncbi:MAG: M48 family metalloprotease [Bradymonadaceae bacterium]|nr:M48 family metalloprotease [Lujinxingiaceae bacterium]
MHVQKTIPNPQPPVSTPAGLNGAYQLYAFGVLVGLFLFLGFYLSVLAGATYLLFILFHYNASSAGDALFWSLFAGVGAATLIVFLFLLKGLFKRQRADRSGYLEITAADEPQLFAFLNELCTRTGAAMPYRVYICPEVNAGVFFDSSVLSLFWPVKKNLLIGLGLVNSLNLSEFKAVLAHEFGHFSQRSMRLNNYVYLVHSVLHNMVHGRDRSDEYLARWRERYFGVLGLAYVLSVMVWLVRRAMGGCLKLITMLDVALSRQMEFHADRVAVSVTGSDAIVHALLKTDYAHQCMMQTYYDLHQAADQQLFTRDVFYHHSRAMDFMRVAKNDPSLGIPPAPPADGEAPSALFVESRASVASIWASHPSYAEREANAKRDYVPSAIDPRTPWLLFANPQASRERMTREMGLHLGHDDTMLVEPRMVQTFIDDEHAEIIFDQKYLGMYDNRFIEPGDLDTLIGEVEAEHAAASDKLDDQWRRLYGDELRSFMGTFKGRIEELQLLESVIGEQLSWGKTFVFRGEKYRPSDAQELFSQVFSEMEQDRQWFGALDRDVFVIHYRISLQLDESMREELLTRYRFHLVTQEMTRRLRVTQSRLGQVLAALNSGELDEEQVDFVFDELIRIYGEVENELDQAAGWRMPLLNNIARDAQLAQVLMPQPLLSAETLYAHELDSSWLRAFLAQFEELLGRLSHIRRKSLGGLLFYQEEVARQLP